MTDKNWVELSWYGCWSRRVAYLDLRTNLMTLRCTYTLLRIISRCCHVSQAFQEVIFKKLMWYCSSDWIYITIVLDRLLLFVVSVPSFKIIIFAYRKVPINSVFMVNWSRENRFLNLLAASLLVLASFVKASVDMSLAVNRVHGNWLVRFPRFEQPSRWLCHSDPEHLYFSVYSYLGLSRRIDYQNSMWR